MIVSPNADPVRDIVLVESQQNLPDGSARLVYTDIDKVLMLCRACDRGVCVIEYWIRDAENIKTCKPQTPCCPKCPQWMCVPCCGGTGGGECTCTGTCTCSTGGGDCGCGGSGNPIDSWLWFDASEIPDSYFTSGNLTHLALQAFDSQNPSNSWFTNPVPEWTGDMREDPNMQPPNGLGWFVENNNDLRQHMRTRIMWCALDKAFYVFEGEHSPLDVPFDPFLPWVLHLGENGSSRFQLEPKIISNRPPVCGGGAGLLTAIVHIHLLGSQSHSLSPLFHIALKNVPRTQNIEFFRSSPPPSTEINISNMFYCYHEVGYSDPMLPALLELDISQQLFRRASGSSSGGGSGDGLTHYGYSATPPTGFWNFRDNVHYSTINRVGVFSPLGLQTAQQRLEDIDNLVVLITDDTSGSGGAMGAKSLYVSYNIVAPTAGQ